MDKSSYEEMFKNRIENIEKMSQTQEIKNYILQANDKIRHLQNTKIVINGEWNNIEGKILYQGSLYIDNVFNCSTLWVTKDKLPDELSLIESGYKYAYNKRIEEISKLLELVEEISKNREG